MSLELPEEEQFEMLCREGRYLVVNDAYAETLGVRQQDLIGTLVGDRLSYSDPQRRRFTLEFIRTRYEPFRFEWTVDSAENAPETHVLVTWYGVLEDGCLVRSWGSVHNLSAQQKIEADARASREELAHAVRISTLGELTASIAHELKQPLTAILSNAQAAERFMSEPQPDMMEIREILADIVKDDRRATEVIRRLRSMLTKSNETRAVLNLSQVVAEVLPLVRSDTVIKGIRLVTEFASSLPPVRGDRVQLQQVVLNLLMNGAEAMRGCHEHDCRLLVSTERHGARGVVASVQDCGVGVSDETREQLFTPFYSTKSGGMGMGLAIARSIVEQHEGRIWVTNNPDRGATVSFFLPVANSEEA